MLLKIVHPAGDVVAVTEIIGYIGAEGETLIDSVGEKHVEQSASVRKRRLSRCKQAQRQRFPKRRLRLEKSVLRLLLEVGT